MAFPSFSYNPKTEEILPNTDSGVARDWQKINPDKWLIVHNTEIKVLRLYRLRQSSLDGQMFSHPYWEPVDEVPPVIQAHYLLFQ